MDIITRQQALQQGLLHYFTGKPCKRGHVARRYVSIRSCIECCDINRKAFHKSNPGKSSEYSLRWQASNPDKVRLIESRRVRHRSDEVRRREALYRERNRGRIRAYVRGWAGQRMQQDAAFRFRSGLASLVNTSIRKQFGKKACKTHDLIGCTVPELMRHLEAQFTDRMTWENYGRYGWHIDHIRPCASFDLTDPEQQRACFHYTNLQPLWWDENIRKGAKVS